MSEWRYLERDVTYVGSASPYGPALLAAPTMTLEKGVTRIYIAASWFNVTSGALANPGVIYLVLRPAVAAAADLRVYSVPTTNASIPVPPPPSGLWQWAIVITSTAPAYTERAAVLLELG